MAIPSDFSGQTFLANIERAEQECAAATERDLPHLGEKAPQCYEYLGMALALIDCAAS